jgi:hypothetical protein
MEHITESACLLFLGLFYDSKDGGSQTSVDVDFHQTTWNYITEDKTLPFFIAYLSHKQVFTCNIQTLELPYIHLIA